jgi:hypothetical protein
VFALEQPSRVRRLVIAGHPPGVTRDVPLPLRVLGSPVVLTWLHHARRNVLRVHPRGDTSRAQQGVFTTRSPDRPNPIGLHRVEILSIDGTRVRVRNLEAVDGTPIVDVKRRSAATSASAECTSGRRCAPPRMLCSQDGRKDGALNGAAVPRAAGGASLGVNAVGGSGFSGYA